MASGKSLNACIKAEIPENDIIVRTGMQEEAITIKQKLETENVTMTEAASENILSVTTSAPPENSNTCDTLEGEEDEDVPVGFFDDFNNKDFLAGLDVVDTWDEELDDNKLIGTDKVEVEKATVDIVGGGIDNSDSSSKSAKVDEVEKVGKIGTSHNLPKTMKGYTIPKKTSRSRSKVREPILSRREDDNEHARKKTRSGFTENRRDPDKVKRDIQRDKARCEKERISERLRIVETGLVPPGTEMDILDETYSPPQSKTSHSSRESPGDSKRSQRPTKRYYSRSPSPYRRKRLYSHSKSPIRTSPARKRYVPPQITHYRSRSPVYHDSSRYDSRRKRYRSRSRSISPSRRYKDRHCSKRERSRSPEVRKQSFLEELDRKLASREHDHLKNIAAKLNGESLGTSGHMSHNSFDPMSHHLSIMGGVMQPVAQMVPVPQMVPAPMAVDPGYSATTYDQSFFVGTGVPNSYNMDYTQPSQPSSLAYDPHLYVPAQNVPNRDKEESSLKFFKDDSISFSEYLKWTNKPDIAQQIDISKKLKVLNICQDSLTILSGLQRPDGRFHCNVNRLQKLEADLPQMKSDNSSPLNGSTITLDITSSSAMKGKQASAMSRFLSQLGVKAKIVNIPTGASIGKVFENIAVQTRNYQCDACEARNKIETRDVGIQCTPDTLEFGAQVTEEDCLSTARNALKHVFSQKSFASLTPAQLLAQLSEVKEDKPKEFEDRRPPSAQDYERRDRASNDFERRAEWNQRIAATPPKQSGHAYSSMMHEAHSSQEMLYYSDHGSSHMGLLGPNQPQPLMGIRNLRPLIGTRPMMRPGFRPSYPDPNSGYAYQNSNNYPVRRFN